MPNIIEYDCGNCHSNHFEEHPNHYICCNCRRYITRKVVQRSMNARRPFKIQKDLPIFRMRNSPPIRIGK